MKKSIEKNETLICILTIIIYLLTNSYFINNYGISNYKTTILNIILSLIIIIYIIKNKLTKYYGLKKFSINKENLYYIPLLLIISVNLWTGININNTKLEIIFYIINMIFVGFLEEIIFRGFLYKMMENDNITRATIISSLTFGIGHIINLFNGAEIIPTLLQVIYATSTGYLFIIIFQKEKSLWPCIITHSLINSLSIFNNQNNPNILYISSIFLIIVPMLYSIYLKKKKTNKNIFQ